MSLAKYSLFLTLFLGSSCQQSAPPKPVPAPVPNAPPQPQTCTQPRLPEGKNLTISINIRGGKILQLSDDSLWLINPSDVHISANWITPAEIEITQGGDRDFSCVLTNRITNSSVAARRINSLPGP